MTRPATIAALAFLLVVYSELAGAQASAVENTPSAPTRRVLILNEVNASYPAIVVVDDAIREIFHGSKYRIQIYREYMDTELFSSEADQKLLRDLYIRKYQYRRPDAIITVGSTPLKFMAEKHGEYFAGIPIIFCLPNGFEEELKKDPELTGVTMGTEAASTLNAALQLLPNTKHVLVVGGAGLYDRQTAKQVKEQLHDYSGPADISYTNDLAMPELLERLRGLPSDYIVLFTSMGRDSAGTYYSSRESAPLINSASSVPVFTLFDTYIGHGEVGGDLSEVRAQGTIAANAALKILDGARPSDIPIAKAPNAFIFDWRALKRWELNERNLPPGSRLLNRQPTTWEAYKWYIVGWIVLFILETALISGLLWQRARRRKTETDLAVTNDRLRLAVEVGKSVGWDWDISSGQNRWFGDLENMFGIKSDSFATTVADFFNYVHPDDRKMVASAVAEARNNHTVYVADFRIVRSDASVRWISARGEFNYAANGNAVRMVGMAVDITDRKESEQKLKESQERFRLLADTAPVLIWTSDVTGLCDYFNRPWLQFTGRSLEQELGVGWSEGVHPEDLTFCLHTYKQAFDARKHFEMEYRLRRYDGKYRWVVDIGIPRLGPDGSFAGYIGSCIDVTERKLAEDALTNLSGKLIAAQEEERSRIAREIHDDYQQRLALVANDLDRLTEKVRGLDDGQTLLRHLWNEVSELAVDMHSLSHRLHSSTLQSLGLVAGVRAFCKEFEQQQEVAVHFTAGDIPRGVPPDSSLCMFRVTQEALRNVKRHSGIDYAEVQLEWTGEAVHLTVADHGRGFDPLVCSPDAGIGIRSMEERLRLVGGWLEVHSRPSQGTRVEAWLPVKVAAQVSN